MHFDVDYSIQNASKEWCWILKSFLSQNEELCVARIVNWASNERVKTILPSLKNEPRPMVMWLYIVTGVVNIIVIHTVRDKSDSNGEKKKQNLKGHIET